MGVFKGCNGDLVPAFNRIGLVSPLFPMSHGGVLYMKKVQQDLFSFIIGLLSIKTCTSL